MKDIIKNLTKAYIKESRAGQRYIFYARIAEKEGYIDIAQIFSSISEQEKEHADLLKKLISELRKKERARSNILAKLINELKIRGSKQIEDIIFREEFPGALGNTERNLKAAIQDERHEHEITYLRYAENAERQGFLEIAKKLRFIALAEKHHEASYAHLLKLIEENAVLSREKKILWLRHKYGYVHSGRDPPLIQPFLQILHNIKQKSLSPLCWVRL